VKRLALIIGLLLLLAGLLYVGNLANKDALFNTPSSPHTIVYYGHNGDIICTWETILPPVHLRDGFISFTDKNTGKKVVVMGDLVITER